MIGKTTQYACRAGSKSPYCFGESTETLKDYAWFDENADDVDEEYAHRVGLKLPNSFGIFDMHGNASEWCRDWYSADNYGTLAGKTTQNPAGPSTGSFRVFRGGSWVYDPEGVRSANRGGFRVVRVVE